MPLRTIRRSVIDLKANRPLSAARARHPRALVFVHVPKCGGSSVEKALRRARLLGRRLIGPEETFRAAASLLGIADPDERLDPASQHAVLMRASELRRDLLHLHLAEGARLVTGHAPLGLHTLDLPGTDVVTVMRSPRTRLRSHLAFNAGERAGHGRCEMTVARFLETERARVMGALYVKYLAGLPMDADFAAQSAIDAARRAVDRLALVGFTEEMDAFAARLGMLAGRRIEIGRVNEGKSQEGGGGPALPEALSDRIHALCAPDEAVYAHARARFGERRQTVRPGAAP